MKKILKFIKLLKELVKSWAKMLILDSTLTKQQVLV